MILVNELRRQGVELNVVGGVMLHYMAPNGITPGLRARMIAAKHEIIEFLMSDGDNYRWQGDFSEYVSVCQPGRPLRVQLSELWQAYHAWCQANDLAPMVPGDFCEWLRSSFVVTRDAAGRCWVSSLEYQALGVAIAEAFERRRVELSPRGRIAEAELRARLSLLPARGGLRFDHSEDDEEIQ